MKRLVSVSVFAFAFAFVSVVVVVAYVCGVWGYWRTVQARKLGEP